MVPPPSFVAIDLAGMCNFRCTTCVLDRRYPDPVLIDWPILEALADVLPELKGLAIGCNAEPWMHPKAAEMLAWARSRTTARVLMISNASFLDDRRCAALVDAGVDELAVSIDGARAETFEAIRLRGSFSDVIANVDGIARRFATASGPELTLIFTSMRENVEELPEVLELAARWGAQRLIVNGYEPYAAERVDARLWKRAPETRSIELARRTFADARTRAGELGVVLVLPELVSSAAERCVFVTPVVGPQGDVSPCPSLSYAREVPLESDPVRYPRRVFGRLPELSFREIWEGPEYVAFREQASCGPLRDDACQRCLVATGAICPKQ